MTVTKSSPVYSIVRDQIEVTMDGTFGGPPDIYRRFIPGPTHYYRDNVEITPEEFRADTCPDCGPGVILAPGVARASCAHPNAYRPPNP